MFFFLIFVRVHNGEITYTIDLDLEEVVVPFDKLVLDVEKARSLQNKVIFKSYDRLSMCKYWYSMHLN